jgi:Bax protein
MRMRVNKKIKSKTKYSNQLELSFRENIKNKKNTNYKYNNSLNAISKIFLSSFIIVSFFFIAPIFIKYADKNFNNKEFTNNSKKILAYTI